MSCLEIIVERSSEMGMRRTKNYNKHGENNVAEDEVDQIRFGLVAEPISGD